MIKKLDNGIKWFLYIILGWIICYLFLLSIFGTTAMGPAELVTGVENSGEHAYYLPDIWGLQVFLLACVLAALYVFRRFVLPVIHIDQKWISLGLCALFLIAGSILILTTQMYPISDSRKILRIAEGMVNGQYEEFRVNEGYLWRYPDQLGIIFFYYVVTLIAGERNYIVLQFINLIAAAGVGLIAKRTVELLWGKSGWTGVGVQLLYYAFAPFLLYTMYVYGTMLGFTFSFLAFYLELYFLKNRRWTYLIGAAFSIGLAVVFKTNSMVMMVAMLIFLLYDIIMERKRRYAIAGIIMILLIQAVFTWGIHGFMSGKSGVEVSEGMPKLAWVAMALQNGGSAPGTWNGSSVSMFEESGYDYDKTNQMAMESIRHSMERFMDDRSEALLWLGRKMAFQWNNPDFGSAEVLRNREGNVPMPRFIKSLIYGKAYYQMTLVMNTLQTVILAGCLFFFVLEDKKSSREIFLPAVAFLGGFIFHIAWEAKSEYVLPYFLMLFPYSIRGLSLFLTLIKRMLQKEVNVSKKRLISYGSVLGAGLLVLVLLYPTRLIQYTIALHDEPELCILYEETVRESIRAVETDNREGM